jgi:hypothetical protein
MANTKSLFLDASNTDYAYLTDGSQTGLDITGSITLEAWIKLESLPASGVSYAIVAKDDRNATATRNYQLEIEHY